MASSIRSKTFPPLAPQKTHDIEAVVDRVVIREGIEARLAESVRLAHQARRRRRARRLPDAGSQRRPNGDAWQERLLNTRYACPRLRHEHRRNRAAHVQLQQPVRCVPDVPRPRSRLSTATGWLGTSASEPPAATTLGARRASTPATRRTTPTSAPTATARGSGPKRAPAAWAASRFTKSRRSRSRPRIEFFQRLQFAADRQPIAEPIVAEIVRRLEFLVRVGTDYLTLDRTADTLSGGERQRVRLATGIGSGLVGVLYLLDEPSIGLHPRDNDRLIAALRDLEQQGNTVVVVEHDEALMRASDHLIDIGPGAGQSRRARRRPRHAGRRWRNSKRRSPAAISPAGEAIPVARRSAGTPAKTRDRCNSPARRRNNLQNVDVEIPLGLFVCVTGVSGSGKSSLVVDTLARALARKLNGAEARPAPYQSLRGVSQLDRLVEVDQSPIGRTPRSNPATYTGVWDDIRRVFAGTKQARQRGYRHRPVQLQHQGRPLRRVRRAGRAAHRDEFSARPRSHLPGLPRCTVQSPNAGRAISRQVDRRRARDERRRSRRVLREPRIDSPRCWPRSSTSASAISRSASRRRRSPAARPNGSSWPPSSAAPATGHTMYILDEPTTGLHSDDIRRLLVVLNRLVDAGNTVLVIEHNLDVIKTADWVIDLGPEGARRAGESSWPARRKTSRRAKRATRGSFLDVFEKSCLPAVGQLGWLEVA